MDYIPVYEGDAQEQGGAIKLSVERIQRSGVRTEPARSVVLTQPVRAVGAVALDERRLIVVSMRSEGYVEDLFVDTTGQTVRKGEPLFRVYSPDIQQALADLLVVSSRGQSSPALGQSSLNGTMRRLRNLGVPEDRIQELRDSGVNPRTIDWPSPASGAIIGKRIINGQRISAGDELYRIADLSQVWVIADVAEGDLADIKPGIRTSVTFRAYMGEPVEGIVTFIYPEMRRRRGRLGSASKCPIQMAGSRPTCMPMLFSTLKVPVSELRQFRGAVIDSGSVRSCWSTRAKDALNHARSNSGRRGAGYVEILEGLTDGEKVVTSANFLIDAESNLQAALRRSPSRSRPNDRPSSAGRRATPFSSGSTTFFRRVAGHLCGVAHAARRHSGPLRHAGHRLHGISRARRRRWSRIRSPIRSPRRCSPCRNRGWCAAFRSSASRSSTSSSRTAPISIGRAAACSNTSIPRPAGCPRGHAQPRSRCHRRRLGLSIRRARRTEEPRRTAHACRTGICAIGSTKAEGVAEVASVGGFVKQYSVVIDPRGCALRHSARQGADAIRASNSDVGGRTVELAKPNTSCAAAATSRQSPTSSRSCVKSEAACRFCCATSRASSSAPDERRGIAELNGEGEVVGGIVLQRYGAEALDGHQERQDNALPRSRPACPRRHDRCGLRPLGADPARDRDAKAHAHRGKHHRRSGLLRLPAACAQRAGRHPHAASRRPDRLSCACMRSVLSSNIMSLGGIAIAIGAMVDAAIVMIENAHKHLERAPPGQAAYRRS